MTSIAQEETVLTRRARRWEGLLPYWLILPTVAYLGLFFVWPMIQGFGLALRDETGNWTFSAFDTMVNDAAFDDAMRFTFLLILVIVPIQFVLAFGMALLLNAKLRGGGIFLYIFLLPLAISDLAAGIAWSAIFTERGYLNTILEGIGVIDQPFIFLDPTSRDAARPLRRRSRDLALDDVHDGHPLRRAPGDPTRLRRGCRGVRRRLPPAHSPRDLPAC